MQSPTQRMKRQWKQKQHYLRHLQRKGMISENDEYALNDELIQAIF